MSLTQHARVLSAAVRSVHRLLRWAKGSDAAVALKRLRELCMEPGGLGTSVLRARAWPLLLGIARTGAGGESIPPDPADVAEGHDNEHQVCAALHDNAE